MRAVTTAASAAAQLWLLHSPLRVLAGLLAYLYPWGCILPLAAPPRSSTALAWHCCSAEEPSCAHMQLPCLLSTPSPVCLKHVTCMHQTVFSVGWTSPASSPACTLQQWLRRAGSSTFHTLARHPCSAMPSLHHAAVMNCVVPCCAMLCLVMPCHAVLCCVRLEEVAMLPADLLRQPQALQQNATALADAARSRAMIRGR